MPDDLQNLLSRMIGGRPDGIPAELLARAAADAVTTRDRQLVAIVAAHLDGNHDLLDVLVRDHLSDHPDSPLAGWIAGSQHQS